MVRNISKNIGRIILSFIISAFILDELHATEIQTKLSHSRIALGESASLTISVKGKSSVTPAKIPAINGLKIIYSGSSHSFQFTNGKTWSGTVLNFSIRGEKIGEYKIPPLLFDTNDGQISSEEKTLIVHEAASNDNSITIRGEVSLSSHTVYEGEPFIMRYFIYDDDGSNIRVLGLAEQPLSKDFTIKKINGNIDTFDKVHVASFYIVPLKKGDYNIGENSIYIQSEDIRSFFSRTTQKVIPCPGQKISVLPVPINGKTANFNGDVGEYKIEVQTPAGGFKQFEEIKIQVKIIGKGNLITLSKPRIENYIENSDEQKIIIEEEEPQFTINEDGLEGEKNYLLTIIPQKDGVLDIGKIFIEYFNPYQKSYQRAESQPITFNILPDERSSETDGIDTNSTKPINNLNWIWLLLFIVLLVVSIAALIIWEKKKLNIIKREIRSDTADESLLTENKSDNLLIDLEVSFNNKDMDMFLLNADRAINRIDPSKLSAAESNKYKQVKDTIYNCRYGPGALTNEDMKGLINWFKGIRQNKGFLR